MEKIAVLVPVYNVEKFLCHCVDSILAQTFSNFALVLIDDGSTDSCGAICDAYAAKDSRVHVIHQSNSGPSAARNTGIEYALRSDCAYITFVDSDDWVHPDFLKILYDALVQNGLSVSACRYREVNDLDFQFDPLRPEIRIMDPEEVYVEFWSTCISPVTKLYKKEIFRNIRFPTHIHYAEDAMTTYKAVFSVEKIAMCPTELYCYYQNADSIMHTKWDLRRIHTLDVFALHSTYFIAHKKYKALAYCMPLYLWYFSSVLKNLKTYYPENKKLYRRIRRKFRRTLLTQRKYIPKDDNTFRSGFDAAFPLLSTILYKLHL